MGSQCFSTTPNQHYSMYLKDVGVAELKDHWPNLKVYKIKKIYDKAASPHPHYSKHTHITFDSFKATLNEIECYQECHQRRLFEIFDYDSQGYLDWNNFYCSISICYFASIKIISIIIFMIFDDHLCKSLNRDQLATLIDSNKAYLNQQIRDEETQEIIESLLTDQHSIDIQTWIKKSPSYFDYDKIRRLFNIFTEEKMEKELVNNFNQWNNLYNQQQQRYISYAISYKWFEAWKIYVFEEYGVNISSNSIKPITNKSIKSKKSFRNLTNHQPTKVAEGRHFKFIKVDYQPKQPTYYPQAIKNLDFVHSNIGERPKEIYNTVLQGEYEEVLKPQLIENRDYILVSEKVWQSLKEIYQGFPQFRRTGYDFIQLYPKVVKIYSSLFRNKIDYSSQVLREVSPYLTVQQLLINSIGIQQSQLQTKRVFFKAIGMIRWEQVTDFSYMFTQLTAETIVFLIHLNKDQGEIFSKTHQKIAKDVLQINVGDYIKYQESNKIQKDAIFMGKNTEGKYVIHFPGQSYIYDECIVQEQFYKKAKVILKQLVQDIKFKNKSDDNDYVGISNQKGIGFINACILQLLKNKAFKESICLVKTDTNGSMQVIEVLAQVNGLLSQKKKVDPQAILDMIEILLPDYQHFQMSMCGSFIQEFLTHIKGQMSNHQIKDIIGQKYMIKTTKQVTCGKCKKVNLIESEQYVLSLPIPQKNYNYYQIIFVPFNGTLQSSQIKRYGFSLPSNALLKDYKAEFQKVANLKSVNYMLVQVYANNIVKNFTTASKDALLSKIFLRQTDQIYAFQLCVSFDKFISDHYTALKQIYNKDFKIDQFVDCRSDERGWIFGKICQIQFLPYTHRTVLRVVHKFSKNQQWQISYDLNDETIASFPTKSYLNGQQYHIRLLQRYFNQSTNEMQLCHIPLVVVLPNWMRWKQFFYIIYLQIKRFIHQDYQFQNQNQNQNQKPFSCKNIEPKSPHKSKNQNINNSKAKLNKFKEYLNSPQFPYSLNISDRDGRCVTCHKFIKAKVFKGQSQNYCEGCNLSQSEPISWQVKAVDIMVCIDWKHINYIKKDVIKDHSSYANLLSVKKSDTQTLNRCLQHRLNRYHSQLNELLCCNQIISSGIVEKISNKPQNLTIYLQRITEDNGFKKTIMKNVSFQMDNLVVNNQKYTLVGVTSVQGNNKNTQYKTYMKLSDQQWLGYDGQIVKLVKKNVIQKVCASVLYYKLDSKKSQ